MRCSFVIRRLLCCAAYRPWGMLVRSLVLVDGQYPLLQSCSRFCVRQCFRWATLCWAAFSRIASTVSLSVNMWVVLAQDK